MIFHVGESGKSKIVWIATYCFVVLTENTVFVYFVADIKHIVKWQPKHLN